MLEFVASYWASHSRVILSIAYNVLLVIIVFIASAIIAKAVRRMILRSNERRQRLDETVLPVISTTAMSLVYIVGAVIILDILGVNTASIIALLGAAGLAVGFALKDTLSNIAAGIMLLALRPFRSGDFVEFGSDLGTVKEISLFTTILETFDGLYVAVPNGGVWSNSIKNFSRNGKRRLDVVVGISYGDSIAAGLEVLRKIMESESRFLQDPPPQTMVTALADSSVNLQLRGWASTDDYWQTLWDLNKRVKEEIDQAGLTIPFPQRDVHLIGEPEAKVK